MNLFFDYVKKSSSVFDLLKNKFNEEQVPFKKKILTLTKTS
jgi:hypothetical protein